MKKIVVVDDNDKNLLLEHDLFEVIQKLLGTQYEYGSLHPGAHTADIPMLTRDSLRALPTELIDHLKNATERLDYDEVHRLIEMAGRTMPWVAVPLLNLLQRYQYQELSVLFQRNEE